MKTSPFIKISLATIIILFLFFNSSGIFIAKKAMAGSFGATVGKAIGAGTACFLVQYGEDILFGVASRVEAIPESIATKLTDLTSVPAIDATGIKASYSNTATKTIDKSKDCMRDVVAKIIIDWIVDQTIEWIQGGGEPKFVTDWEDFLSDAFQSGVGTVINESNFRFLCSPFRAQVRLTLLPVKRFPQRVECTLDQVVENIEDFYNDFSKGGWIAYNEMWQPQNNYYGQILLFYDEAMMKGLAAKEAAEDEAAAGGGFLSVKRCVEYDEEYIKQCEEAGGTGCRGVKAACNKWETHTPGYIVGEAAAEAMTSDIKWAYNIKGWIASLINAVINRLITEGIGYMKTSDEEPTGYGTADYKGDFNPTQDGKLTKITTEQYQAASAEGTSEAKGETIIKNYEEFLKDREAILAYKQSSLSYVQQTIAIYDQLSSKGCSVAQSEIDEANKAQSKLNKEITELQSQISEIETNLAEAKSIPTGEEEEGKHTDEWVEVGEKYTEFISEKYPNILSEVYSGSAKSDAKDEADKWSGKLSDAQAELDSCTSTTTP